MAFRLPGSGIWIATAGKDDVYLLRTMYIYWDELISALKQPAWGEPDMSPLIYVSTALE